MLYINHNATTGCASEAPGEQQHEPPTASQKQTLRGPPGCFLQSPPEKPVNRKDSDAGDSSSEQDSELQSTNKLPLAPPPGIFTQSSVSEKASKIAPPPGVFVQSRVALPCLLGRSFSRHTAEQQEKQESKRCESKAPLAPPPGVFVPASSDFQAAEYPAVTMRDKKKAHDANELPLHFRAPPGLEHIVSLSWDKDLANTKPCKLSRAPSDDDLSTIVGSTFLSSSAEDPEEYSSEDEATPSHRTEPRPAAQSSASVDLHLDDLVNVDEASHIDTHLLLGTQMPMIPFVPTFAVQMAWQQFYGGAATSGKCNRKQGKA